jgi:hypothetical protein
MSARIRSAGPWIVSVAALVIALELPANAARLIRSADIRDNTIASRDIRNSSIVGADVRDGRIESRDIRDGTVAKRDLAKDAIPAAVAGTPGPPGAAGAPGAPGLPGAVGPTFGRILETGDIATFPDAPFDATLVNETVDLPTAGKLLVFGSWDAISAVNCANADFGLSVDGGLLSGSNHRVTAPFDDDAATIIGITTAAIAAGTHTVRMVAACDPGGPNQQVITPSARVGVVLLGG